MRRVELGGEREIDGFESVAAVLEPISAEEAVLWEAGEEHESGSDEGMTAVVAESDGIDA